MNLWFLVKTFLILFKTVIYTNNFFRRNLGVKWFILSGAMIFSHLLATSTSILTSTRCDVTKMEEVVSLYNEAEEHFKDQVMIWKGRTFWNSPTPVANMMHMTCTINPNNVNTNTKQIQIQKSNMPRWRSGATMPGLTTTQAGGSAWTSTLWVWSDTDWHWSSEWVQRHWTLTL